MFRRCLCVLLASSAAVLWSAAAQGQFVSLISDFESFPDWYEEIMFRHPSVSGSTTGLDPLQGDLTYLTNVTYSPSRTAA